MKYNFQKFFPEEFLKNKVTIRILNLYNPKNTCFLCFPQTSVYLLILTKHNLEKLLHQKLLNWPATLLTLNLYNPKKICLLCFLKNP
ncbi:hypothetical protein Barb6XT_03147 [Bacteroidales bacterium Barb6XT]|nr:hypothetical protein Barb6XT_03147 [Bacteroidales bacterium Barb6XT]